MNEGPSSTELRQIEQVSVQAGMQMLTLRWLARQRGVRMMHSSVAGSSPR